MFTTSLPDSKIISRGISVSDFLIDINVGVYALKGHDYRIGFSFTNGSPTENPIVESSRPDIVSVFQDEKGHFYLHGKCDGDTVLEIRDSDGYTHYRNVVHCRSEKTLEEMMDYLLNGVDHWQSWLYEGNDQRLYFMDDDDAVLEGKDEGTPIGSVDFMYVHEPYDFNGTHYEDTEEEYFFRIPNFECKATSLALVGFFIGKAGDMIHTMTPSIASAVFTPVF